LAYGFLDEFLLGFGGVYWKKSEFILNKIPNNCSAKGGAENKTERSGGQRGGGFRPRRTGWGRNFFPPSLSAATICIYSIKKSSKCILSWLQNSFCCNWLFSANTSSNSLK